MSDESVVAFVEGKLPRDEADGADRHLAACDDCRRIVAETTRWMSEQRSDEAATGAADPSELGDTLGAALPPGTMVSRYELGPALGMGSWGIVYHATDPELQRRVAVKILRHRPEGEAVADARLLREARAMAQLSHPNVVNVFDVGTYRGMVFVVMELVPGETLAEWLTRERRGWRSVLEAFVFAARGLAAAHAAGLVHRDFKPENVLVGADGRVRVTDFGLVRIETEGAADERASASPGPAPAAATAIAGTPMYMAPEQLLGRKVDARTDQFSFCVALYQALYGTHPFGGVGADRTMLDLASDVVAGKLRPPRSNDVPARIAAALACGLSADPARRHASMAALIAALPDPAARPWPRAAMAAASILVLAAVGAAVVRLGNADRRSQTAVAGAAGRCGDGKLDADEECDDGNAADSDACPTSCRWARCGDGLLRAGVEDCDDGNDAEGDGCSARCLTCTGGDARFVWKENGSCYLRHDVPASWPGARAICHRLGAELVAYTGQEPFAVLQGLLRHRDTPYWIAMRDAGQRAFGWVTGESTQFMWWAKGEPRPGSELCVYERAAHPGPDPATRPASGTEWSAESCIRHLPYTCEKASWTLRPRDNHAYRFVFRRLSWPAARDACAALGAHLVTIEDAEEAAFLLSTANVELWTGGSDREVERRFTWITGEEFRYRKFAPGEPDDPDGTHDCVLIGRDREWHDRGCDNEEAFACEIE